MNLTATEEYKLSQLNYYAYYTAQYYWQIKQYTPVDIIAMKKASPGDSNLKGGDDE